MIKQKKILINASEVLVDPIYDRRLVIRWRKNMQRQSIPQFSCVKEERSKNHIDRCADESPQHGNHAMTQPVM